MQYKNTQSEIKSIRSLRVEELKQLLPPISKRMKELMVTGKIKAMRKLLKTSRNIKAIKWNTKKSKRVELKVKQNEELQDNNIRATTITMMFRTVKTESSQQKNLHGMDKTPKK